MSIKLTHRFEGETYFCHECDKDLARNDIEDWYCSECGTRVQIQANLDQAIMRKLPVDFSIVE